MIDEQLKMHSNFVMAALQVRLWVPSEFASNVMLIQCFRAFGLG